jgi:hypothetical protein
MAVVSAEGPVVVRARPNNPLQPPAGVGYGVNSPGTCARRG